jgi:putative SOS response-associated peptidase YedK
MCGRATLSSPAEDVASLFEVAPIDIGVPRFNIAPTQPMVTVRAKRHRTEEEEEQEEEEGPGSTGPREAPGRELALMRWGLIPWWAKPDEAKKIASRCIQARAETAPRTPAFRDAFRRHRCLVVVDGFFEWKSLPDGRRVPHHVRRSRGGPFAIAAVWDSWRPRADGDEAEPKAAHAQRIESCAVLTTPSAGTIQDLHDRMPLILPANEWNTWLGGSAEEATRLLEPDRETLDHRTHELAIVPVSTWVNDVRHDDPRCIEPAPLEPAGGQIDFTFAKSPKAGRSSTSALRRQRKSR